MKPRKKRSLAYIALAIAIALISINLIFGYGYPKDIKQRADELYAYCKKNGYNTHIGIIVDYGVHSGKCRYFVWDFAKRKAVVSSVCPQGKGRDKTYGKDVFSNKPGSKCSSLGHYSIGKERKMYTMDFYCFELDGLDASNSNARARSILLHPTYLLPISVYPLPISSAIPYSSGCITIPPRKYKETAKFLRGAGDKPVIMWVYN